MTSEKLKQYFYLVRLHKPIGIFLLLWPTLWALWLASGGQPKLSIFAIFVLGVVLMRSAGCIINDLADRHFDAQVQRTRMRPLVTGKVRSLEAFILFCILSLSAFILVLLLNRLTILLAIIGMALALIYPYLKRYTHLPQLGLGAAFSWGVPMAFAAEINHVPAQAWWLFVAAAVWPVIYDTMYAMTDREDDLKIGIKSTAILFGKADRVILALLQVLFLVLMIYVGTLFHLEKMYYASLGVGAVLMLYQQWLMRNRNPQACFHAFLNNNWLGLIIFAGIVWSLLHENCC